MTDKANTLQNFIPNIISFIELLSVVGTSNASSITCLQEAEASLVDDIVLQLAAGLIGYVAILICSLLVVFSVTLLPAVVVACSPLCEFNL